MGVSHFKVILINFNYTLVWFPIMNSSLIFDLKFYPQNQVRSRIVLAVLINCEFCASSLRYTQRRVKCIFFCHLFFPAIRAQFRVAIFLAAASSPVWQKTNYYVFRCWRTRRKKEKRVSMSLLPQSNMAAPYTTSCHVSCWLSFLTPSGGCTR